MAMTKISETMNPHHEMLDALPEYWREHFPRGPTEAATWKPIVAHRALAMRVLCAAQSRIEGTWNAYVRIVAGYDHTKERDETLRSGTKLDEDVALAVFPKFRGVPYAR